MDTSVMKSKGTWGQWLMSDAMAYSDSWFDGNMMAGDANDDFYVYQSVLDENDNEIVNYGLNNNRFKIYSKDGWLTYNKSYLQLPKSVSDAIERNKDSEDDFVTRNAESNIFYNPYGQRVKADTKGIVISNGKKRVNR